MGAEFKPMTKEEQEKLRKALDANVLQAQPLRVATKDTSFVLDEDELTESLINSIQSVPTHY